MNYCAHWKDSLLDAALTGSNDPALARHLESCPACSAELKALQSRQARLDELLPLVVRGAAPSHDFRARVLSAAEARAEKSPRHAWRIWTLAGATASAFVLFIVLAKTRAPNPSISIGELAAAQKLAEFRAPSDTLLATPGSDLMRSVPKLGKTYWTVPAKND